MKAGEAIEALKEFFFDFIGFLVPGFLMVTFIFLFLDDPSAAKNMKVSLGSYFEIVLFVVSYCGGYIVYGFAMVRDEIVDKLDLTKRYLTPNTLGQTVKESLEYQRAIWILKKLWGVEKFSEEERKVDETSFATTRSNVMSYIPEADAKIYGFMFRSELCNHLNVVLLVLSIIGILSFATIAVNSVLLDLDVILISTNEPPKPIFKDNLGSLFVYILMLVLAHIVYKARIRFLSITYRIPLAIFISKYYKLPK